MDSRHVFSAMEIARFSAKDKAHVFVPTVQQSEIIEYPPNMTALVIAGAGSGKTETIASRVVWLIANGFAKSEQVLGLTFTEKAANELNERIQTQLLRFVRRAKEERGALSALQCKRLDELEVQLQGGLNVPQVQTYHSFASSIIDEFGTYTSLGSGLQLIDSATSQQIVRELIDTSADPRLASYTRSFETLVKEVLHFEHESSEHVLADLGAVHKEIDRFLQCQNLPEYDEEEKKRSRSVLGARRLFAEVEEKRLLVDLAQEFREIKRSRGLIEFSDQVFFACRIIEELQFARARLRERFPFVLLDEVQDTSVSQNRLLSRLFRYAVVLGVGDPHQSIYEWRAAAADALEDFYTHFSAPADRQQPLHLSVSWRNAQTVLRFANRVVGPLREKSGEKLRVPSLQFHDGAARGEVVAHAFETVQEEFSQLAEWVKSCRENFVAEKKREPTSAILLRKREMLPLLEQSLSDAQVPYHIVDSGGLFYEPEIVDFICLLECVEARNQNALIRLLRGGMFQLSLQDLAAFARLGQRLHWNKTKMRAHNGGWPVFNMGEHVQVDSVGGGARVDKAEEDVRVENGGEYTRTEKEIARSLRKVLLFDLLEHIKDLPADHELFEEFSSHAVVQLRKFGHLLKYLRSCRELAIEDFLRVCEQSLQLDIETAVRSVSPAVLGEEAGIGRTGGAFAATDVPANIPEEVAERDINSPLLAARANLDAFIAALVQAARVLERPSLSLLLAWIDRARTEDEFELNVPPAQPDVVQILTVHKAKGLEWDIVAIPNLREGDFPGRDRNRKGWVKRDQIPDELRGDRTSRPHFRYELASSQKDLERLYTNYNAERDESFERAERRLMYVAVTRAKTHLWLSGSFWKTTGKPADISRFLREFEESGLTPTFPAQTAHTEREEEGNAEKIFWPLSLLGRREAPVLAAAEAVKQQLAQLSDPEDSFSSLPEHLQLVVRRWQENHVSHSLGTRKGAPAETSSASGVSLAGGNKKADVSAQKKKPRYRASTFYRRLQHGVTLLDAENLAAASTETKREGKKRYAISSVQHPEAGEETEVPWEVGTYEDAGEGSALGEDRSVGEGSASGSDWVIGEGSVLGEDQVTDEGFGSGVGQSIGEGSVSGEDQVTDEGFGSGVGWPVDERFEPDGDRAVDERVEKESSSYIAEIHASQTSQKVPVSTVLPPAPSPKTRLGTRFHAWVEQWYAREQEEYLPGFDRDEHLLLSVNSAVEVGFTDESEVGASLSHDFSSQALFSLDGPDSAASSETQLLSNMLTSPASVYAKNLERTHKKFEELTRAFQESEWAQRVPLFTEVELNIPFASGRMVCKIDAIFPSEEPEYDLVIVDWKTGRIPQNEEDRSKRMLQIDLYRLACANYFGVELDRIKAGLCYFPSGTFISVPVRYTREELESLIEE